MEAHCNWRKEGCFVSPQKNISRICNDLYLSSVKNGLYSQIRLKQIYLEEILKKKKIPIVIRKLKENS